MVQEITLTLYYLLRDFSYSFLSLLNASYEEFTCMYFFSDIFFCVFSGTALRYDIFINIADTQTGNCFVINVYNVFIRILNDGHVWTNEVIVSL